MRYAKPNLSINSLAEEFSVTRATIWRWRKDGKIPKPDFFIGDHPYWIRDSLYKKLTSDKSELSLECQAEAELETSENQLGGQS